MSELLTQEKYPHLFDECIDEEAANLSRYKEGSHKKMLWRCSECGNEWMTEIRVRAQHGCGCPKCSNNMSEPTPKQRKPQKVEKEKSFGFFYPELVTMWDYDRNEYTPFDYKPKSEQSVYWKCERCGHEFQRRLSDIVRCVHKCPKCANGYSSSFGECLIYYACVEIYGKDKVFQRNKDILGFEVDVLIPEEGIGFEYGAWRWHQNKLEEDKQKIELAKKQGIELHCIYDGLSVFDEPLSGRHGHAFYIQEKTSYEDYVSVKKYLSSVFGEQAQDIDWNLSADKAKATMHEKEIPYEKSLEGRYPAIVDEWDYDKNYPITPDAVASGSHQKYFFHCEHGHSYQASAHHKAYRQDGCPICQHIVIQPGINSFAAENPQLMPYWDWDKNSENPDAIAPLSAMIKNEWYWKCPECRYEWTTKQSFSIMKKEENICPACQQRTFLLSIIEQVHFNTRTLDYMVSPSLFEEGDIKNKEYRLRLEKFVREVIIRNQYSATGNNKFLIIETENIYIRVAKHGAGDKKQGQGVIRQCYILDSSLGEKTLLGKKGEAAFSNVTPVDNSFGTRNPELMSYWDWSKNERDPYDMPDNIQAQERWYWKCPDCGNEWSTTRPPKCDKRNPCSDCRENSLRHWHTLSREAS